MIETVIRGSGNSRTIATVPNALTLYPTHEELMTKWGTEGIPVDIKGPNSAGCSVIGTSFSKAAVLPDSLATALGLTSSATPAQAMDKLRTLVNTAQSTASGKCQIVLGSYAGSGEWGADHPNSLTFSFAPAFVMIPKLSDVGTGTRWICSMADMSTDYASGQGFFRAQSGGNMLGYGKKSSDGKTLYWYATTTLSNWASSVPMSQLNQVGTTYNYIAIG